MKLRLPNNISSRQDLRALILEIREYAKWFSQTAIKIRFAKDGSFAAPAISPLALDLIKECSENGSISQKGLDELIVSLEDFAAKAPAMTITLAAPAPGSLKKSLVDWCRQNIAEDILVDFRFNSTMLGGMVVQYGSHVYDWSFRRQILANLSKFPEVLRHV